MRRHHLPRFTSASSCLVVAAALVLVSMEAAPAFGADGGSSAVLAGNTASKTPAGATFTAPAGWTLRSGANDVVMEAPEGNASVAIVDTSAPNAEGALAEAWKAYRPGATRPVKVTTPQASRNGWEERHITTYETSPNERMTVFARRLARRPRAGRWCSSRRPTPPTKSAARRSA